MNYTVPDHPMRDVVLLAMASLSKVRMTHFLKEQINRMDACAERHRCEFVRATHKSREDWMLRLLQVLIVTLRPTLKVMFTHALKGDAATLPLLAWQFVIIQVSHFGIQQGFLASRVPSRCNIFGAKISDSFFLSGVGEGQGD